MIPSRFIAVLLVLLPSLLRADTPPVELSCDICIVGGGSAGFGAALAASRSGASVILIEQNDRLGGTSTSAYVSSWEPGPGDAFARELYDALKKSNAAGISRDANGGRSLGPFGLWQIQGDLAYDASLRRAGTPYPRCHGVVFDPDAMSKLMRQLLEQTGTCRILLQTRFVAAEMQGRSVQRIIAESLSSPAHSKMRIAAPVFIDCTGDVALCRSAGCETMLGIDPRSRFDEPGAPEQGAVQLNGISWCYRIRPSETPTPAAAPEAPVKTFTRAAHVVEMPNGDRIVNPLGLLPGEKLIELGYDRTQAAARPVVQAHWQWLQKQKLFAKYQWVDAAPMLGIRESWRVVTDYVLTQQDLTAGLANQKHADIIALADHAIDIHGSGRGSVTRELASPYGIPYRCLLPRGTTNLLVACRGAGFSHIAASSCRLSRTMLALGHAAGWAAAEAVKKKIGVREVDMDALRREMGLPRAGEKAR